jgi:hypothetical protein
MILLQISQANLPNTLMNQIALYHISRTSADRRISTPEIIKGLDSGFLFRTEPH